MPQNPRLNDGSDQSRVNRTRSGTRQYSFTFRFPTKLVVSLSHQKSHRDSMLGNSVHAVELVFLLLLLFVVVFAALARKIQVPYPIVLVIAGLVLGFIPGMPHIPISPDVIFLVVLPPLLYPAAWFTSWRDFSYNIVSILFLAFGLVGFTVWGVAEA